jgi:hypothetical protein
MYSRSNVKPSFGTNQNGSATGETQHKKKLNFSRSFSTVSGISSAKLQVCVTRRRIGSSNPAVSFLRAKAPSARQKHSTLA